MPLILLVEDSSFARKMTGNILKTAGYEVIEAENGLKGLELVQSHSPDCILADILMPEMDGLGLLQALKDRDSRVPIVMMTADVQSQTRQDCLRLGAWDVLYKPPRAETLLLALEKALAGGR